MTGPEKLRTGTKNLHPIVKNGAAFAGAMEACEQFDPQKLAGLLIPDQATVDKAMATGNITRISPAVLARQTDWNGLTPEQERQKDDERLSQKRLEEVLAEAEYEQTMQQVRQQADRLMTQLDERDRELRKQLAEVQARPVVLADGRVVEPDANGKFTKDKTGQTLSEADKADAELKQKQKEAQLKVLNEKLAQDLDAKDHLRKAKDLTSQNVSPKDKKQNEAEAQKELALGKAEAKGVAYVDVSPDADMGAALGLDGPQNDRPVSVASTLDKKDSRAIAMQDQFTRAGQGANAQDLPSSPDGPAPAGTTAPKTQIIQPIQ